MTSIAHTPLVLALTTLLTAPALGGCAGSRRETAPGPVESVSFRFAWPDGFRAQVSLRHESHRQGAPPTIGLVRQVLEVEARGKELWVSTRQSEGEGDDPDLATNLAIAEAIVQVVGRDGRYLRAEGIDKALDILASQGDQRDREEARRTLRRLAAEDWEAAVGLWSGQRLELGKPRHRRIEASLPLIPGIPAAMDAEHGLEGLVPCDEGETQPRCAELTYRMRAAPTGKADLLRRLAAGLPKGEPAVVDVAASSESILVTDPQSLIPRRLTVRQELRIRLRMADGTEKEVEERSLDEYRFAAEVEI
jgi:hypothetical protein